METCLRALHVGKLARTKPGTQRVTKEDCQQVSELLSLGKFRDENWRQFLDNWQTIR